MKPGIGLSISVGQAAGFNQFKWQLVFLSVIGYLSNRPPLDNDIIEKTDISKMVLGALLFFIWIASEPLVHFIPRTFCSLKWMEWLNVMIMTLPFKPVRSRAIWICSANEKEIYFKITIVTPIPLKRKIRRPWNCLLFSCNTSN